MTSSPASATVLDTPPSFTHPVSQPCTQAQFEVPEFKFWCREIREPFRYHRKVWELCYILQNLARTGMMAPGRKGLGFGVGKEPTVAVLASRGVQVLATDLDAVAANDDWVQTDQHASGISDLNEHWICPPDLFEQLVDFRVEDMNAISPDLTDFDFAWSTCALEHLGSIQKGLDFIRNSLKCVKPGGYVVHTTELNCQSDDDTLEAPNLVIFRQKDFRALADQLTAEGHKITLNFQLGNDPLDRYVDEEPYTMRRHVRLRIGDHVTTAFGIVVQKGEG